jgi:pimeloyl-ACP methyl ester carboxylesterase
MIAVTVVAAALAVSTAAPLQTSASDRLIDAAGLRLHIRCDGIRNPRAPLVVLEAGAGNSAATWRDVFAPIARFARTCAYDRPGLGTSEQTPQPRRPMDIITTLHALLDAAAERPPYVMVGHSWGGEIVRLYAMHYASEVVGLVLIDSSHEEQVKRFAAIAPAAPEGSGVRPGAVPAAPAPEQADLETMGAELSKQPWRANIPLVVLTRTPPADPQGDPRGRIWQELQKELSTRSPRTEHIVATKSGHYIQNDEPPLVIDAVRRVVANATP